MYLKSDEVSSLKINKKKIEFILNRKYLTAKVGNIFFPSIEDLKVFVNKLSDMVEDLEEAEELEKQRGEDEV